MKNIWKFFMLAMIAIAMIGCPTSDDSSSSSSGGSSSNGSGTPTAGGDGYYKLIEVSSQAYNDDTLFKFENGTISNNGRPVGNYNDTTINYNNVDYTKTVSGDTIICSTSMGSMSMVMYKFKWNSPLEGSSSSGGQSSGGQSSGGQSSGGSTGGQSSGGSSTSALYYKLIEMMGQAKSDSDIYKFANGTITIIRNGVETNYGTYTDTKAIIQDMELDIAKSGDTITMSMMGMPMYKLQQCAAPSGGQSSGGQSSGGSTGGQSSGGSSGGQSSGGSSTSALYYKLIEMGGEANSDSDIYKFADGTITMIRNGQEVQFGTYTDTKANIQGMDCDIVKSGDTITGSYMGMPFFTFQQCAAP